MKRSTFLRAIAASATTAALGRDMALDAARHWRAGTPGTDPEDALRSHGCCCATLR